MNLGLSCLLFWFLKKCPFWKYVWLSLFGQYGWIFGSDHKKSKKEKLGNIKPSWTYAYIMTKDWDIILVLKTEVRKPHFFRGLLVMKRGAPRSWRENFKKLFLIYQAHQSYQIQKSQSLLTSCLLVMSGTPVRVVCQLSTENLQSILQSLTWLLLYFCLWLHKDWDRSLKTACFGVSQ